MKRLILPFLLLIISSFSACASGGAVDTAMGRILAIPGFSKDTAPATLFNFPESFGDGDIAVAPNAHERDAFEAVLDAIPADLLEGRIEGEDFDVRLYIEPAEGGKSRMLYTIVGTGGADTIAMTLTLTAAQVEEVVELWARHIEEEEAEEEEIEQDFGEEN